MPRKSAKSPPESKSQSTSKRPAANTPERTSKRARATSRKSYVESDTDSDAAANGTDSEDDAESGDASDFEAQSDKEATSESEPDEDASDEEPTSKKATPRGRVQRRPSSVHKNQANEKELWKPGAKLEPGTQLIIKKPKAREAGDTPYTESTIHPNTMLFLEEIKANNDRQWLKLHDPDYRVAVQDFNDFVGKLSEKIVEIDETIPELPVKDIVYRIYRDVRFSKDQTPYKTYFSAAWSRTGRKGPYAAYYVQIQPDGGSFVGGGLWQPDAEPLRKLRREIDRRPIRIKQVLTDQRIRTAFLGGTPDNEKKVIKAFIGLTSNASTALKRHPKDFPIDHKDIDLLRLRSFTLGKKLSDEEVVGPEGMDRIAGLISCIEPFITYLNSVVMPDEESSSSSDEDENGEGSSAADGVDE
ncbi:hypothetical protein BU25DRAFT_489737 [Macroventuria anomochaeta]|uniref:Uncharacterized protein n=1 Tax=Macroventuria anomochaeta TaxID=301207 RepID=A0ACB6S6P7_9PLEO|nr:uncharacterized protein BU25DRAFT_489737 [Macroventuria anomochaeta]KAF2629734.1 hypothetical protein BU25DRAFT_489737 [Macroventuria anomochaeta]